MTSDETTILTALQAAGVSNLSGTIISEFVIDNNGTLVRVLERLDASFLAQKIIGGAAARGATGATAPLAVTALLAAGN